MASAFCCSTLRLFLEGQLILATLAIHAPLNSLLISGRLVLKVSSAVFPVVGLGTAVGL
jgi:hypothetical protein